MEVNLSSPMDPMGIIRVCESETFTFPTCGKRCQKLRLAKRAFVKQKGIQSLPKKCALLIRVPSKKSPSDSLGFPFPKHVKNWRSLRWHWERTSAIMKFVESESPIRLLSKTTETKISRWWQLKYFFKVHPDPWENGSNLTFAYFSKGLKPPEEKYLKCLCHDAWQEHVLYCFEKDTALAPLE